MIQKIFIFIFSFLTWCFIAWPYNFENNVMDWQVVIIGLIISLFAALISQDVFHFYKHKNLLLVRIFWSIIYIPVLFYLIILANFDVLYRVIHPKMPIRPGIVKIKTRLKTDAGLTALANSITLTPGTLTVDITKEGFLYVHCINVKETDVVKASKEIIGHFEFFLEKIFE